VYTLQKVGTLFIMKIITSLNVITMQAAHALIENVTVKLGWLG